MADAAERKTLADREYLMEGSDRLKVNLAVACTGVENLKNRLRRNKSSKKEIEKASFIKMQEVVVEAPTPGNLFHVFRPEPPPAANGDKEDNSPSETAQKESSS